MGHCTNHLVDTFKVCFSLILMSWTWVLTYSALWVINFLRRVIHILSHSLSRACSVARFDHGREKSMVEFTIHVLDTHCNPCVPIGGTFCVPTLPRVTRFIDLSNPWAPHFIQPLAFIYSYSNMTCKCISAYSNLTQPSELGGRDGIFWKGVPVLKAPELWTTNTYKHSYVALYVQMRTCSQA